MNTNKRLFFFLLLAFFIAGSWAIYYGSNQPQQRQAPLAPLSLALDWTPNTNHTGIYVALAKKWYEEEGMELKMLPYSDTVSPDVLVNAGKVDAGISSTESI